MKIGVISDIHGNFEALKVVLSELDRLNIKEIYCLGDVAGYYSQINECCDALIERNIPNLMGNHDWYMVGGGFCPRANKVNDLLHYQRKVITKDNFNWLKESSIQRRVNKIHMVHGGWSDPIDEYIRKPSAKYFSKLEGEFFMSGHTHKQSLHKFGNKLYCCPGSVGQPRDRDPRAAFAIVEDYSFTLHRVAYDMQKVFGLMERAGFNRSYYKRLLVGK